MSRPNNTIEKMRVNAWHLMGLSTQGLFNEAWSGEDFLNLDDLCCKMAGFVREARKAADADGCPHIVRELLSSALFAFEEFYDLGPGQPPKPSQRPPEALEAIRKIHGLPPDWPVNPICEGEPIG